jgi:amino acid permease
MMFPGKARTWTVDDDEETMGDTEIIINLLADLSPAGVLPLSYGMSGTGYVPALIMLVVFALAAGYMMYLIGRTVELSGAKSYDKIWSKVVGPGSAWVPTATVWLVTFGCCMAYACMFGDLFAGCMPAFGLSFASRTVCIIILGVFPLLPLCMLRDLSALAPTSFGALVAVLYTVIVMAVRRADGSYMPGGQYYSPIPEIYLDGSHVWNMGASSLVLVNSMAVAYLCHYNGCKYYREYINHRPDRFGKRIVNGFSIVTVIFALAMTLGYGTFGGLANGVVLNNYSKKDTLANIARLGMGLANVFSFPLMFSGLREANIALLICINPSNSGTFELIRFQNALSAAMLFVILLVAILVTDAGLVVGLVGAVCGSAII